MDTLYLTETAYWKNLRILNKYIIIGNDYEPIKTVYLRKRENIQIQN